MGRATASALILLALSLVLSLTPIVKADPWNRICTNSIEYDWLNDSGVIVSNFSKICHNGCNNITLSCDEPYNVPVEFFILVIVSFLGISALFFLIANKFKDDWGIIPILFYIMGFLFIVMDIGIMGSYFVFGQNAVVGIVNTAYYAAGILLFLFVAYIILRFILSFAIRWMESIAKKKRRGVK